MEENKKESKGNNVAAKSESETTTDTTVSTGTDSSTKITDAEVVKDESTNDAKESTKTEAVNPAESGVTEEKQSHTKQVVAFIAGIAVAFLAHALITGGSFEMSQDGYKSDEVVAKVNGEKIYGEALNQQVEQFALVRGYPALEELDEEIVNELASQALDALINTELIAQAAAREGFEVNQEEIDAEYTRLVESIGGEEAADARFAELGTTAEDFREGLESEILVGKYIDVQMTNTTIEISDEEVEAYYNQALPTMPDNPPSLEEIRPVIVQQLQAQQQQAVFTGILQSLREGALIEEMI